MDDRDTPAAAPRRRAYTPPQLTTVDLELEQVLGMVCKSGGATVAYGFTGCGISNNCNQLGS